MGCPRPSARPRARVPVSPDAPAIVTLRLARQKPTTMPPIGSSGGPQASQHGPPWGVVNDLGRRLPVGIEIGDEPFAESGRLRKVCAMDDRARGAAKLPAALDAAGLSFRDFGYQLFPSLPNPPALRLVEDGPVAGGTRL